MFDDRSPCRSGLTGFHGNPIRILGNDGVCVVARFRNSRSSFFFCGPLRLDIARKWLFPASGFRKDLRRPLERLHLGLGGRLRSHGNRHRRRSVVTPEGEHPEFGGMFSRRRLPARRALPVRQQRPPLPALLFPFLLLLLLFSFRFFFRVLVADAVDLGSARR